MKAGFHLATRYILVVAVPLFIVTSSLRLVINDSRLYSYGFAKYNIAATTGISYDDLLVVGQRIRDFFNQQDSTLDMRVAIGGVERELFNQQEKAHMEDVRNLVRGVVRWQLLSSAYVGLYILAAVAALKGRAVEGLASALLKGCALTLGLLVIVGMGSLVGFDRLFLQFHLISFSNELWILDPTRDYLIMIFPWGFFLDATLAVVGLSVAQAALFGAASYIYLRFGRRLSKKVSATNMWKVTG